MLLVNDLEGDVLSINNEQNISELIKSLESIGVPYSTTTGLKHYLNFLKSNRK